MKGRVAAASRAEWAEAKQWLREHRKELPKMKVRLIPRDLDHRAIERRESSDPINRRELRELRENGLECAEIIFSYGAETTSLAANSALSAADADSGTRNAAVRHDHTRRFTVDELASGSSKPETIAIIREYCQQGRAPLPTMAMMLETIADYNE